MSVVEYREYSVLMSVYHKEKPEYLKQAIESIQAQTFPTDDFVLVCDGSLNDGLDC
jgi:glycosyltransferase involved in cell wall biosynthesis